MSRSRNDRLFTVWEVLGLALLTCIACAFFGGLAIWIDLGSAERAFKQRADSLQRDLAHRFGNTDAVLTSLVGLHHASDDLRTYEFAALSRELLAAYPFIRTIAEIPTIRSEERRAFEDDMRTNGFPQFRVVERSADGRLVQADARAVTMPIRLFEPLEPELARFVGFDVLSDPALSDAVELAISGGAVVASEPLEIANVGRGFFVFKAIYLGHSAPESVESRKAQVRGLIALYLESEQFFSDFVRTYGDFGLRLFDAPGEAGESEGLIFGHEPPRRASSIPILEPFTSRAPIVEQGKTFVLEVTSHPDFGAIRFWLVALLVLVAALACVFLGLALRNYRIGLVNARASERILRRNEQRFRDYAEIASDWFWSTDKDLRFDYFSRRLTTATGLEPDALLGKTRADLSQFGSDDQDWQRHLEDLEAHRPFKDFRYRYTDATGRTQWWAVSGKPVYNEDGKFVGYRGTGRNVTVETEARETLLISKEEAELANRAKSEFLANVSHELRTPLNAIIGFSELITSETFGPVHNEKYRDYASAIHESGEHLLALINDILDLSKVESGVEQLYEEEIEIPKLVRSLVALMKHHADKGEIELSLDVEDGIPALIADQRKLKQILVNLLGNAIKFTPPGGRVALKAWCSPGDGFVFQITDTGIGMAPEDIPKAFSKFRQIDSALDRKYEGTGLGLPLTKALTELHGGALDLQSEVGRGTTVTVRLPATRAAESGPRSMSGCASA